jgi:hypothetical protein
MWRLWCFSTGIRLTSEFKALCQLEKDLRGDPAVVSCFMKCFAVVVFIKAKCSSDTRFWLIFGSGIKLAEARRLLHRAAFEGGHVLSVDDEWEHLVDLGLEVLDAARQWTNEGLVEKDEVGEEVVPNKDVALGSE